MLYWKKLWKSTYSTRQWRNQEEIAFNVHHGNLSADKEVFLCLIIRMEFFFVAINEKNTPSRRQTKLSIFVLIPYISLFRPETTLTLFSSLDVLMLRSMASMIFLLMTIMMIPYVKERKKRVLSFQTTHSRRLRQRWVTESSPLLLLYGTVVSSGEDNGRGCLMWKQLKEI